MPSVVNQCRVCGSFAAGNLNCMQLETELRLRGWLEHGGSLALTALSLEHLRVLLNLLYIGLCECLGLVTADGAAEAAVNAVCRKQETRP